MGWWRDDRCLAATGGRVAGVRRRGAGRARGSPTALGALAGARPRHLVWLKSEEACRVRDEKSGLDEWRFILTGATDERTRVGVMIVAS